MARFRAFLEKEDADRAEACGHEDGESIGMDEAEIQDEVLKDEVEALRNQLAEKEQQLAEKELLIMKLASRLIEKM